MIFYLEIAHLAIITIIVYSEQVEWELLIPLQISWVHRRFFVGFFLSIFSFLCSVLWAIVSVQCLFRLRFTASNQSQTFLYKINNSSHFMFVFFPDQDEIRYTMYYIFIYSNCILHPYAIYISMSQIEQKVKRNIETLPYFSNFVMSTPVIILPQHNTICLFVYLFFAKQNM